MKNKEIADALLRLCPDAKWTLAGDSYSDIEWLCECSKPTLKQIEAEVAKAPEIEAAKAATRTAILDRLGITEEEARILLG